MGEHHEQVALINWARSQETRYPELKLLYANPLGGKRPKRTAVAMMREGARAGVPDLTFPVARGGYFGLYIELKWGRNTPTPKQRWWIDRLQDQGYRVEVCWGFEEARDLLLEYLRSQPTTL